MSRSSEGGGGLPSGLQLRRGPDGPTLEQRVAVRMRALRADRPPRPGAVFDPGLQHERTALAWERTAISLMVAGVLMARYAAEALHWGYAAIGIVEVVFGGLVLLWAGRHYDDLHGPLRAGESPAHPDATRVIGLATITSTGLATLLAVAIALRP